jgi:hypothetical protein
LNRSEKASKVGKSEKAEVTSKVLLAFLSAAFQTESTSVRRKKNKIEKQKP